MTLDRYPNVFRPFAIGGVEIRNRIFLPAHTTNFAENFLPTARHLAYLRERAAGGVGLMFMDPLRVHRTSLGRAGGACGAQCRKPAAAARDYRCAQSRGRARFYPGHPYRPT